MQLHRQHARSLINASDISRECTNINKTVFVLHPSTHRYASNHNASLNHVFLLPSGLWILRSVYNCTGSDTFQPFQTVTQTSTMSTNRDLNSAYGAAGQETTELSPRCPRGNAKMDEGRTRQESVAMVTPWTANESSASVTFRNARRPLPLLVLSGGAPRRWTVNHRVASSHLSSTWDHVCGMGGMKWAREGGGGSHQTWFRSQILLKLNWYCIWSDWFTSRTDERTVM